MGADRGRQFGRNQGTVGQRFSALGAVSAGVRPAGKGKESKVRELFVAPGRWMIAIATPKALNPEQVRPTRYQAERCVVLTGNDHQVLVRHYATWNPPKNGVRRSLRGADHL